MVSYRIEVSSNGTTWGSVVNGLDIMKVVYMDSIELAEGFKFGELHEKNSLSFTVDSDWATSKALSEIKYAKLYRNDSVVFTGIADEQNASVTIKTIDSYSTELKFSDLSTLWEDKTFVNAVAKQEEDTGVEVPYDGTSATDKSVAMMILSTDGYKVCDPSDTSHSLIHALFNKMVADISSPITVTMSCTYRDTTSVSLFIAKHGDSIKEVFNDVLSQNGLSYWMDNTTLKIYDMLGQQSTGVEIYDIETEATIERKDWLDTRLARVRRGRFYKSPDNHLCGKAFENDIAQVVKAGSEAGITEFTLKGADASDDTEAIAFFNLRCEVDAPCTRMELCDSKRTDWNKWQANCENTAGLFSHELHNYLVYGTAYYKSYSSVTEYKVDNYNPDLDVEKLDYVFSDNGLDRYVKAKTAGYAYEKEEWSFYADEQLSIGSLCTIRNMDGVNLVITHRTDSADRFGGYTYTASPNQSDIEVEYVSLHVEPAPFVQASNVNLNIVADRNTFYYDDNDNAIITDPIRAYILMDFVSPVNAPIVSLGTESISPTKILAGTDDDVRYAGYYYVDITPTQAHNLAGNTLTLSVTWNDNKADFTLYKNYEMVGSDYVDTKSESVALEKIAENVAVTVSESKVDGIEVIQKGTTTESGTVLDKPAVRISGDYVIDGSVSARKMDVQSIMAEKLHLNNNGVIYAGGYDENGDNASGQKGIYISADGDVKANKLQAFDIDIQSKDSSDKTILSTFMATDRVETKTVSAESNMYKVSDVVGTPPTSWTAVSSSYNGNSYGYSIKPASTGYYRFNPIAQMPFSVHEHFEDGNDWQHIYLYSDSTKVGTHADSFGMVAGGFSGRWNISFRTSSEMYKDGDIYYKVSNDGGATWGDLVWVGNAGNLYLGYMARKFWGSSVDTYYNKSWSWDVDVTPNTVVMIRLWSHYSAGWWETGEEFDYRDYEHYYGDDGEELWNAKKRGRIRIVSGSAFVTPYKYAYSGKLNLANSNSSAFQMDESSIFAKATEGNLVYDGRNSVDYLRYIDGTRVCLAFGSFRYSNRVDNATYTLLGNVGKNFTWLTAKSDMVSIDGNAIYYGGVAYAPDGFSCTFTTVVKESGIEATVVYSESTYSDNLIGMVAFFYGTQDNVPKGWVKMVGSVEVTQESLPKLYAWLVRNKLPTTLPDMSSYSGRNHGQYIVGGTSIGTLLASQNLEHSHGINVRNDGDPDGWEDKTSSYERQYWNTGYNEYYQQYNTIPSTKNSGGDEARPDSIIMLPCIYAGE